MSALGRNAFGVVDLLQKRAALKQLRGTLASVVDNPRGDPRARQHAANLISRLNEIDEDLSRLDQILITQARR